MKPHFLSFCEFQESFNTTKMESLDDDSFDYGSTSW